jgi:thioesterase domain-containing protein/NAD(P)-dependent dehydrogenase (short-subunit alcohol dehydrogenase family)/acyl carrier protein
VPGLHQAAAWGLLRSAQAENPGRIALVDVDGSDSSWDCLAPALSLGEPEVAIRDGEALVPRLAHLAPEPDRELPFAADGTVLITGGTGDLGGLLAAHLVAEHGVRHVLLASRSGGEAPGAEALRDALEQQGAEVRIASCDFGDRDAIAALLDSIDPSHPLTGVVHAAAALDDGVFTAMSAERLERVLAAKADAAWHLHELTRDAELGAFVLFSSISGTIGGPGQSNYAAANVFLDALAAQRRAAGLPATSIAWGLWQRTRERAEELLRDRDVERLFRAGFGALADDQGLMLFDLCLGGSEPAPVAAKLNFGGLRTMARSGELPPVMRELVRMPAVDDAGHPGPLAERLASADEGERTNIVVEFLRKQIADVLGQELGTEGSEQKPFLELGFDSLTALQFRNRLNAATGLKLSPSIAFDHPTPAALATHVVTLLDRGGQPDAAASEPSVLTSLLRGAHERGRSAELLGLLGPLSGFRPSFASPSELGSGPSAIRLAHGPERPALACLPSAAPISGPHEYAKLARGFDGERDVIATRWPGFDRLDPLPANLDAALEVQLEALGGVLDEAPPVLVGHSTGGVFAYALAQRLAGEGRSPSGVVLIDSYHPSQTGLDASTEGASIGLGILGGILAAEDSSVVIDDVRLTAMAAYLGMVARIETAPLECPVLLIRATDPIGDEPAGDDWSARWEVPHELAVAPGNHLTMMDEHVDAVSQAVSEWLHANFDGSAEDKPDQDTGGERA